MFGVKGTGLQQGYIWVPYVIAENVSVISGTFSPNYNISSRYSKAYLSKQSRRIEKIKNILNKKDP